jgi:hypothetical protein
MDIFYSYIKRKKNKEKSMSLRVAKKPESNISSFILQKGFKDKPSTS